MLLLLSVLVLIQYAYFFSAVEDLLQLGISVRAVGDVVSTLGVTPDVSLLAVLAATTTAPDR